HFFFARVRAALRAAAERPFAPLVRAAFFAAAERWPDVRLRAALRACFDSAFFDAAEWPSRFNALLLARERLAEVRFEDDFFAADFFDAVFLPPFFAPLPFFGTSTPARRASDNPIAIACSVERAPCLPSRTWSISSRTNSPAWVLADLPSRLSFFARAIVFLSGMSHLLVSCAADACVRHSTRRKRLHDFHHARAFHACHPKHDREPVTVHFRGAVRTVKFPPGCRVPPADCRECGRTRWPASCCATGTRTACRATAPCRD